MKLSINKRYYFLRKTALVMAFSIAWQAFFPTAAYALTGGPSQPEVQGFQSVGTSDMVDLFTGDFKYNIPLLDVGGYPLNLSYQAGSSNDDEASWVGLGWSLNPGTVTRNMRGIPDDFKGDAIQKDYYMRPNITVGGKLGVDFELFGCSALKLGANVGVFHNSYRGLGVEMGLSPSVSLGNLNMGVNLESNSQNGLDMSFSGGLGLSKEGDAGSLRASIGFNSRQGLKDLSFSYSNQKLNGMVDSRIDFMKSTYVPTNPMPIVNNAYNFNFTMGGAIFGIHPDVRVSGYWNCQKLAKTSDSQPAFGYLHLAGATDKPNAVMDYNKERGGSYKVEHPMLSPITGTYDLFSASGQGMNGQFRLSRNDIGIFRGQRTLNTSTSLSAGAEIGFGNTNHNGANLSVMMSQSKGGGWTGGNGLARYLPFNTQGNGISEPAYFKNAGESPVLEQANVTNTWDVLQSAMPRRAELNSMDTRVPVATNQLVSTYGSGSTNLTAAVQKSERVKRNDVFSYLTAEEAAKRNPNKAFLQSHVRNQNNPLLTETYSLGRIHQPHHISEINITQGDGSRYVYGVPAYNNIQHEVTFAVKEKTAAGTVTPETSTVPYTAADAAPKNGNGRDEHYEKQTLPGYAYAYLLTEVLSPDYVDLKNDGVTDDDIGTAVKLNYTRKYADYKWRTPVASSANQAQYQEGNRTDTRDGRANIVYGDKEIWYVHSVSTKTMVAHFHTSNRADAFGVNENGSIDLTKPLQKLDKVELYSKSDLARGGNITPVKTVHFQYEYTSCKGIPNQAVAGNGKLTLKKVYFTYGKNVGGDRNAYTFDYNNENNAAFVYSAQSYDRWGNFKPNTSNPANMTNKEYPYATQDNALANTYANGWNLKEIHLPSGGRIQVEYESDDYAYVQDRRAGQMFKLLGFTKDGAFPAQPVLYGDKRSEYFRYLHVDIANAGIAVTNEADFKKRFLEQLKYIHLTAYVALTNGNYEYVKTYAEIDPTEPIRLSADKKQVAIPVFTTSNKVNPLAQAAFQKLRSETPYLIYPGYDETLDEEFNRSQAERLFTMGNDLAGLFQEFIPRGRDNGWAKYIVPNRSWARLDAPTFRKLGGGCRVKSVKVSNYWGNNQNSDPNNRDYGQVYDYSIKNLYDGSRMSSGVAAYEPSIGGDENPFKEPIVYTQEGATLLGGITVGPSYTEYLEQPFGESLFPSPTVGYSQVTVSNILPNGVTPSRTSTGFTTHTFYTAKEFPTKTTYTDLDKTDFSSPLNGFLGQMLGLNSQTFIGASQGFSVETNDMHGKPRLESVYNAKAALIASTQYTYKTESGAETFPNQLKNNQMPIITADKTIKNTGIVGYESDLWQEMIQESSNTATGNFHMNFDVFTIPFVPPIVVPAFTLFPSMQTNDKMFRGAVTTQAIKRSGIVENVTKMENGSTVSTRNLLWDAETGQVLLTETQNEFEDPLYQFTYPAHWEYDGMGLAYKNANLKWTGVTLAQGTATALDAHLSLGDEFLLWPANSTAYGTGIRAYVVWADNQKRITDEQGQSVSGNFDLKLIRSGRRNLASTPIGSVTLRTNPIATGQLNFAQVLNAQASIFRDDWAIKNASFGAQCVDTVDCRNNFSTEPLPTSTLWRDFLYAFGQWKSNPRPNVTIRTVLDILRNYGGSTYASSDPEFNGMDVASRIVFSETSYPMQGNMYGRYTADFISTGSKKCRMIIAIHPISVGDYSSYGTPFSFAYASSEGLTEKIRVSTGKYPVQGNNWICAGSANEYCAYAKVSLECATCERSVATTNTTNEQIVQYATVNPYQLGVKGNWRPYESFAVYTGRTGAQGDPIKKLRTDGILSTFQPFVWSGSIGANANVMSNWYDLRKTDKWVKTNTITHYDQKGNEIENRDALGIYSSALYRYSNTLAAAVTANAQVREIAFDGFEDYGFTYDFNDELTNQSNRSVCYPEHWDLVRQQNQILRNQITRTKAHTGNFSVAIAPNGNLTKTMLMNSTLADAMNNTETRAVLDANHTQLQRVLPGFALKSGQKYVLSAWVSKDGNCGPTDLNGIQILVNNVPFVPTGNVIEGWQRVEQTFIAPAAGTNLTIQIKNGTGQQAYLDDIRMLPFNAKMKSFAYDARTLRLMAQLDENNYATFYEYDDEGSLIRTKRETERGIVTLQENRNFLRAN
jgi:hypothetical protein